MGSDFVTTSMGGEAYAQWVRRAIAQARSAGGDVVALFDSSVEEPVELLRQVVERGFGAPITPRYQSVFVNGNPFVLDALATRYGAPRDHILTTTGATSGLSLVYRAFLRPGDHILIESPGFDLFGDIGRSLGVDVGTFPRTGDRFRIDEQEIAARITPRTRLIVLSDLHNPSGMLLDAEAISRLARLAADQGALLVVDEVYGDYAGPGRRVRTAAHLSANVIAVNSLTKIFGLSTLRCGWVIAHPDLLAPIRQVSDRFEFGVSKLSHAVAALVLEESDRFEAYSRSVLQAARPVIERHLKAWQDDRLVAGSLPEYGCIFFPNLIGIPDTLDFSSWLANEYGVIVAPGEFFGAAGHVRIGFAHSPEALDDGLSRFTRGLREFGRRKLRAAAHA